MQPVPAIPLPISRFATPAILSLLIAAIAVDRDKQEGGRRREITRRCIVK
jgi:hypothetical protein